eukprot:12805008-Ditylum_brightwellii.AAC.1
MLDDAEQIIPVLLAILHMANSALMQLVAILKTDCPSDVVNYACGLDVSVRQGNIIICSRNMVVDHAEIMTSAVTASTSISNLNIWLL